MGKGGIAINRTFYHEMVRMRTYMEKHYWENIGIEDVAKHSGYSPRRCNLLFKEYFGETIGSYLTYLRMEDAKLSLAELMHVDRVAASLSYTSRGFRKTFREYFGVSPSEFLATGENHQKYKLQYQWRTTDENWNGQNPTPDGLWEFGYYDPAKKQYLLMEWEAGAIRFRAPFTCDDWHVDPNWYCRNRAQGNGMHAGRATHAVRTFLCPYSGTVEVFFSVGRIERAKPHHTPCSLQLWHNDCPLDEPVVLVDQVPHFVTATLQVEKGDRIRLHEDPMGDHVADGIWLYRQQISYTKVSEPYESRIPEGVRSHTID